MSWCGQLIDNEVLVDVSEIRLNTASGARKRTKTAEA